MMIIKEEAEVRVKVEIKIKIKTEIEIEEKNFPTLKTKIKGLKEDN